MAREKNKPKQEKKETPKKAEGKKAEEKKVKVEKRKHEKAIANGLSLRISPKHAVAICKVITKRTPEAAVKRLEAVVAKKRSIPMRSLEVAHQKGKGVSGAKYPVNACKEIIVLIKQVAANATTNEIENPIIIKAMANRAAAPYRVGGRKAKRTHLYLEVVDKTKLAKTKN